MDKNQQNFFRDNKMSMQSGANTGGDRGDFSQLSSRERINILQKYLISGYSGSHNSFIKAIYTMLIMYTP